MLEHGIEFYHSYSSADLITRLTQSAQAARNVVDTLVTSFVRDLFSLIGLVLVMVDPAAAAVARRLHLRAGSPSWRSTSS